MVSKTSTSASMKTSPDTDTAFPRPADEPCHLRVGGIVAVLAVVGAIVFLAVVLAVNRR